FLIGCAAGPAVVDAAVARLAGPAGPLALVEDRVMWRGREALAAEARVRGERSAELRARLEAPARWLKRVPYLRMTALTGSLAMDHASRDHDVDLLCVAAPGRVWLVVSGMRVAHWLCRWRGGVDLCPNCVLDASDLAVRHENLYMAHQLAHLLPVAGGDARALLQAANPWVARFLPNAFAVTGPEDARSAPGGGTGRSWLEALCPAWLAATVEQRLHRRGWQRALRFYGGTHPEPVIAEARHARRYMMPGLGYGPSVYRRFVEGHAGLAGRVDPEELPAAFGGDPAELARVDPRLDRALSSRYASPAAGAAG
ncbi:MAG: hypothetical protein RJA22_2696, partial [Verrucomicrobiota bacterium]